MGEAIDAIVRVATMMHEVDQGKADMAAFKRS